MSIEIRRILIPLDFSHHAEAISQVILVHAYHLPVEFQQLEGAYLPPDFWTNVKTEAQQVLERHAERLRAQGVAVETVVREGYPATVIQEEAEEQRADLIVIGTRGLSGLKHLLLGSVAERVVQKAPCPVLTVKTPG
jgi:nucleotide-binding universal stress UspA family protein